MNSKQQLVQLHRYSYSDYLLCQQDMRDRARQIADSRQHEIWIVQHDSIFTLGQAADKKHLLDVGDIPVVQSNRGGQVSWHGPGQIVIYVLFYLPALELNVRELVTVLEQSVIHLLAQLHIAGHAKKEAPGVYVGEKAEAKKIASVGLRISRSVSYHGLSFNYNCSLEPFDKINTCGYPDLEVTRLIDLCDTDKQEDIALQLCCTIAEKAGLTIHH